MGAPMRYGDGQPDAQLGKIGDIGISQYWVTTPNGPYPIRGSVWTVTDMTYQQESMSPAGVVLCILFIWVCLLGLLFLLMKDRRTVGYIQVTVSGSGFHYATMVPAFDRRSAGSVHQMVNYARTLAAAP